MEVTQRIAVRYGLPVTQGLWVISVDRNSPATNAGISTQDIIIEINGKAVTSVDDLRNAVYKAQIGRQAQHGRGQQQGQKAANR